MLEIMTSVLCIYPSVCHIRLSTSTYTVEQIYLHDVVFAWIHKTLFYLKLLFAWRTSYRSCKSVYITRHTILPMLQISYPQQNLYNYLIFTLINISKRKINIILPSVFNVCWTIEHLTIYSYCPTPIFFLNFIKGHLL